ncbi:MAG: LamG domain-containing protein, partial [bacterium]
DQAAAQICVPPPSGLVSWWPGDGNANDIRNGHPGASVNGATFGAGKVDQAFSLDGVDDYVDIGDISAFEITSTSSMSVTGWIKTSMTVFGYVVNKMDIFTPDFGWYIRVNSDGSLRFVIADNDNRVFIESIAVNDGNWHHFAATHDGGSGEMNLYVDGVLSGSATEFFGAIDDGGMPLRIGISSQGFWPFAGFIDEVSIYSRAISAQEVLADFNAGSAGKCKKEIPLLDHFKCYRVRGKSQNISVDLEDQFGIESEVPVRKPKLFCNPVDKNGEGVFDPSAHLTCYTVRGKKKKGDVVIDNQFGTQTLHLGRPKLLCVPSEKLKVMLN